LLGGADDHLAAVLAGHERPEELEFDFAARRSNVTPALRTAKRRFTGRFTERRTGA
jgi:hypothetical protein